MVPFWTFFFNHKKERKKEAKTTLGKIGRMGLFFWGAGTGEIGGHITHHTFFTVILNVVGIPILFLSTYLVQDPRKK